LNRFDFLNTEAMKNILDSVNVGIHIVDKDGTTICYNSTCEEIEGISSEWIIGTNMINLVNEGVYSESVALQSIHSGRTVKRSQRVNNKYIYSTGVPIFVNDELVMVVVSVMDMTKIEDLRSQYSELREINLRIQSELSMLSSIGKDGDVMVSKSKVMEDIKHLALRIAKVDSTVLIEGESGVGKGVLSKFIHDHSNRKEGPFIKVDCSALPESLIESELFGYEEGAFTGARKSGKVGLIQLAHQGTLFLDEIGELPINLQVKLLNVIQHKVFQKVGGTEKIDIDTRIIAATNRNLERMVDEGRFRSDLYYRLKVVPITLPSLRDRRDDIVPLAKFFLDKHNSEYNFNKSFSPGAYKALVNYSWPGNIRELENEVERLVVTTEDEVITESDLVGTGICTLGSVVTDQSRSFKENVTEYERLLLEGYLKNAQDIHQLSQTTGLEESTLRKKAKRIGIDLEFGGNNSLAKGKNSPIHQS
jgi:PAS domain S-box-containing protein